MDAARKLVRALAGSARAVEARSGISGAQLFILRQLAGVDGPLSVNELAELTLTHQSTVSGVVTRLVERRLVTRTPSSDDARRVEIALTTRGRALLAVAPATVQTQLVSGLARLTASQRTVLADALEAWLDAAGLRDEPSPLFFEADEPEARRDG
jgi:DNA-binding MarR family transcriptional regulator